MNSNCFRLICIYFSISYKCSIILHYAFLSPIFIPSLLVFQIVHHRVNIRFQVTISKTSIKTTTLHAMYEIIFSHIAKRKTIECGFSHIPNIIIISLNIEKNAIYSRENFKIFCNYFFFSSSFYCE